MGNHNDDIFRVPFASRIAHLDEIEKQENKLRLERLAAQAQAYHAQAYREIPEDLRTRAKEWGVSALMEAVWINGWDCGYRQCTRDRSAAVTTAEDAAP
jgi:hypothetical protein